MGMVVAVDTVDAVLESIFGGAADSQFRSGESDWRVLQPRKVAWMRVAACACSFSSFALCRACFPRNVAWIFVAAWPSSAFFLCRIGETEALACFPRNTAWIFVAAA
ncbi:hypothetical protein DIPPA_01512 [Diplonema papillatum]|nr:hypothetical protein DIPPA_01512 [Diplonema papillatum]